MCMVYYLLVRDIIYTKYTCMYVCMYCTLAYIGIISLSYILYEDNCEWSEGNILACMGQILNNSTIAKLIIIFSQVYA